MKRFYVYLFAALLPIVANAQYDDDMYFGTSSKKSKTTATSSQNLAAKTEQSSVPLTSSVSTVTDPADIEVYNKTSRDEDEYNRRYNYSDYQGTVEQAIDTLSSDVQYVDDGKNSDYDINDDESDYRYSRRILRFHSPHVGVIVSSPYYWDLVYDYGAYDFLYADYYYYDPFFWGSGWGYAWGWRPWHSWYSPIWGYHYAYDPWYYWGYGPMWGGYHHYRNGIYPRGYSGRRNHHSQIARVNSGVRTSSFNRGSRIRSGVSAISARGTRTGRTSALGGRTGYASTYNGGLNQDGSRSINGRTTARTSGRGGAVNNGTYGGRTTVGSRTAAGRGGSTIQRGTVSNTRTGTYDSGRGNSRVVRNGAVNDSRGYNTSTSSSRSSTNTRTNTTNRTTTVGRGGTTTGRATTTPNNSRNTYTPAPSRSSSSSSSRTSTPAPSRSSSSSGGSFGGGRSSGGSFGGGGGRGGSIGGGGGGARGGRR